MLRSFAFALALGAVPLVWPMYQFAPEHNAVFAVAEPPYHWRYDAAGKINGGLAVSGNMLFVETFAPAAIALDRRTGRPQWNAPLPNLAMTTPIVADGLVVVGTGSDNVGIDSRDRLVWSRPRGDEVAALDARTGAIRWTYQTQGEDMPSPALVQVRNRDAIVFANGDDHVRALDLHTGRPLWTTAIQGVSTMASAAASGGIVYVLAGLSAGSHQPDRIYAVRSSNGSIVWSAPYGNADVSPTIAGGTLFVEDAQTISAPADRDAFNDVEALAAATGRLRWQYTSGTGFLTTVGTNEEAIAGVVDRGVFFQSLPAARRFAAFDAADGRLLWSVRTVAAVKMSAVVASGRVYVGDTAGMLYTISEGTGSVLSERTF
ncbi:MAG: PQQ-binding-like beta-propeller repeat protein, partial [Candidatus Eremiobacteraeota bacterium]|nr:PQQ-binding-like beta-propeller repeat protein [Candidatus Eremiobacteraeota bacterium]